MNAAGRQFGTGARVAAAVLVFWTFVAVVGPSIAPHWSGIGRGSMSVEEILELLESTSKEYRELSDSLVPPHRSISMNNRVSSEVALEVAIALDGVIEKIRSA